MSSGYTPFGTDRGGTEQVFCASENGVNSKTLTFESLDLDLGFEVMKSDDSPQHKNKACQHYRRQVQPGVGGTTVSVALDSFEYGHCHCSLPRLYASSTFGPIHAPFNGLNSHYGESTGIIPEPPNLATWKQRALSSMMPEVKSQLSLVNSIIELKDFHSYVKVAKNLWRWVDKSIGTNPLRNWRKYTKGSDAYLQWKFNIAPLISDICGIHAALSRSQKRLNDLTSRNGKRQTRHWSHSFQEEYAYMDHTDGPWYNVDTLPFPLVTMDARMERSVYTSLTEVHIMLDFSILISQYEIENARLLALLDELGVNLNPSIIWNAIPYSFIVDWVFKVGKYLEQFQMKNLEPQINIHQGLWSVKRKRITTLRVRTRNRGIPGAAGGTNLVSKVFEDSYRRDLFMPSSNSLEVSGLNSSEFSLGAALIHARRRRH